MAYTVKQLATLSGVTARTLHFYDEAGLLKPSRSEKNGYRQYGEEDLLRLQQILFFRELEFPVAQIKRILNAPSFDMRAALRDHRELITLKKKRLSGLVKTIDRTLEKLERKTSMDDQDLYGNFTKDEMDAYAEEAKRRWGDTEAYRQSRERVARMSKEEMNVAMKAGEDLIREIVAARAKGAASPEVQALIERHYDGLRTFYEPNLAMYRGLGNMYADDPRFTAYYEKFDAGLAVFLRDAINAFCDTKEAKA